MGTDRRSESSRLGHRTASSSRSLHHRRDSTATCRSRRVWLIDLAVDNRHNTGGRPSRLDASHVDQGFDITVTEGTTARGYSVYRKPVAAGSTVALPRIGSATAPSYLVIVQ